jgi:hypothetical protein
MTTTNQKKSSTKKAVRSTSNKSPTRSTSTTSNTSTTSSTGTASTTSTTGTPSTTNGAHQGTRTGLSAPALLQRLQQIADGVQKHQEEPGFPSFFSVNDIQAIHDRFALEVVQASADKGRLKGMVLSSKQQLASAHDLYQRGVLAVESYMGLTNPLLSEFGLKPRKGPGSSHAKAMRTLRKREKAKVQKAAAAKAAAQPATAIGVAPNPKGGV